jgi:hypothetical protein
MYVGEIRDITKEDPVKSMASLVVQPVGNIAGNLLLKLLKDSREICQSVTTTITNNRNPLSGFPLCQKFQINQEKGLTILPSALNRNGVGKN